MNKKRFGLTLVIYLALWSCWLHAQELKRTKDATIRFVSEAPLELIRAESSNCQGILDLKSGEFAFRIFIKTFDGFNNPLQKEHFYENYMEVSRFPDATYTGQMIESIDFTNASTLNLRSKGNLSIHGETVERIIDVELEKSGSEITFRSDFEVLLVDHNIEIPNIVRQKIAEKINVSVTGTLK